MAGLEAPECASEDFRDHDHMVEVIKSSKKLFEALSLILRTDENMKMLDMIVERIEDGDISVVDLLYDEGSEELRLIADDMSASFSRIYNNADCAEDIETVANHPRVTDELKEKLLSLSKAILKEEDVQLEVILDFAEFVNDLEEDSKPSLLNRCRRATKHLCMFLVNSIEPDDS